MSRTRFLTAFRVFITIAFLLMSLPLSSPNITVQAAEPVAEEPERTPPGMRLYAIVDPAVVAPGSEATCTVTVANEDLEDETGLTLHASIARDLSLAIGEARTWEAEVPPLKVGERAEVVLDLLVAGRPEEAMTFEVELRDAGGAVRATTTAVVGVARPDAVERIGTAGGSFAAEDGRVQVDFPLNALPAEASVTATMKTQRVAPWGRVNESPTASDDGALLQFTLEAQDTTTGEEIQRFDQPVALSVDMRGLIDESGLPAGQHLYLAYLAAPDTGMMKEVETAYDAETGLLTAEIDHFSEWEIGMVGEGWKPILTPPVPDLFSGAAVYNYPVQVAPGRNGLQPSVALSYNSRRVDTLIKIEEKDGGSVALGWSLGASEVEVTRKHDISTLSGDLRLKDAFSLVLNGASYDLEAESGYCGRYKVIGAPGVYVERFNDSTGCENGSPSNRTTDYWIVRVEGTTYRLGYTHNSEAYIEQENQRVQCTGYCSPDPDTFGATRWRVDTVTDRLGNQMAFTYREKEIETDVDYGCMADVFAQRSMVTKIEYNDYDTDQWASWVEFVPVSNDAESDNYMRINRIDVYHLETRVRQIALTADKVNWGGYSEWALLSIQELSGDGSVAMPPVEFGHVALPNYQSDYYYRRVNDVNLGYGGRVTFAYESDGRSKGPACQGCDPEIGYSYRVSETQTYDGMGDTPSRVAYDYGTRCYDQTNANTASDGTNGGALCRGAGAPYRGPLVGHSWVETTALDFAGTPVLTTTHQYYISDTLSSPPHWLRGREWRTQVHDGDGTLLQQSNTTWAGDREFNYVSQVVSTDYTGAEPLSTKTTYSYTLAAQGGTQYGNLTHVREYGDGDTPYRTTVVTYTVNSDEDVWIVGKPREVKVYEGDVGEALLGHTQNYYDYHASLTTPPVTGTLTLVKQINPLSATHVITTEYKYDDDWGNLTDVWDPLGNHIGIEYEDTYHMYPITATNTLDQHRYVQYYGINASGAPTGGGLPGQVWQVWDDNGLDAATKYTYDVFGRLKEVIAPYDGTSYPTVAYLYDETTADTRVVHEYYSEPWKDTLYNSLVNNNWLLPDVDERDTSGYVHQRAAFRVAAVDDATTKPLYRLFNHDESQTAKHNTLYTSSDTERQNLIGSGWEDQGIVGYVWNSSGSGREPLYRCSRGTFQMWDHALAVGSGNCPADYTQDGVVGYVEPAEAPIRVGAKQREMSGQMGTLDSYVYYDGLGRQVQARGEAEGGQWTVASTEYDALGRAVRGYVPQFEDGFAYSAPDGIYTFTTYDALGRAVRVDNPDGTYATTVYSGLVTTAIDANGHQRRYTGDVWGQLVTVEEFTRTVPSGVELYATTEYDYDTLGHLVTVTDTNEVTTTIHYDGLGRKDWMDDPDMGHWEYRYDNAGNLVRQLDANGQLTCFFYDELGRLEGKKYRAGVTDIDGQTCGRGSYAVEYRYDEAGHGYGIGRRTSIVDASGSASWVYDARGRVVTETKVIDTLTFTTQYVYDAANRPVYVIYPDGEVVAYAYNDGGGLESLSSSIVGQNPYVTDIDYNPMGQITSLATGNAVTTTYTYHPLNFRLENVQVGPSGQPGELLDLSYTYDPVGNVKSITDDVIDVRQQFEYDDLDRLTRGHQEAITSTAKVIAEVGFIDDEVTHGFHPVTLTHTFENPVVFVLPPSRDGTAPSVVRITDVQPNQFTIYIHEAPDVEDNNHATESVSYIVLEAGSWTLPDGTRLEVGTVDTAATVGNNVTNVWETVSFSRPLGATPVVISQVQTRNDTHWVKTRQQNETPSGFEVALEEDEAQTTAHGSETIGWLAIEPGTGTWNGHKYEAAKTSDAVTHDWYTISFGQSFSQAPCFVASLATYDGTDNAHLRYSRTSLTASGVQAMVEEDTTYDTEMNHTTEVVHYLAIEGSGMLTATAVSGTPGGLGYYDRDYAYDKVGNVTHKDGMGEYDYDDSDHVHAVTHIDDDQRYWYDDNGNMTTRVVLSGTERITYTQAFNAENKLEVVTNTVTSEITTFVYDGDGVRVKKEDNSGTTYYVGGIYEVFYPTGGGAADAGDEVNPGLHAALSAALGGEPEPGQPPTVVPADPGLLLMGPALGMLLVLGRRRQRYGYTRARRTLAWSVGNVLLATAIVGILAWFTVTPALAAGPVVTKYYYAGAQRVAMRKDGAVYYLHGDHLGSTNLATDTNGDEVLDSRVLYYPYGEVRYGDLEDLPTDFTFTGQRVEKSLGGLMDYNARFYDPALGRFVSADTITPDIGSQALNRYMYVTGNPVRYSDPTGHGGLGLLAFLAVVVVVVIVVALVVSYTADFHEPTPTPTRTPRSTPPSSTPTSTSTPLPTATSLPPTPTPSLAIPLKAGVTPGGYGSCVLYARARRTGLQSLGSVAGAAGYIDKAAERLGVQKDDLLITEDTEIQVGYAIVWPAGHDDLGTADDDPSCPGGECGHIAIVEAIDEETGQVLLSEEGWDRDGDKVAGSKAWVPRSDLNGLYGIGLLPGEEE